MEYNVSDKEVLRDLALVYIAMAHGADQDMDDAEADAIVDRLRLWQAEAETKAIHDAVGEALRTYTTAEATANIERAVADLRQTIPKNLRQFILEDLMDIALADDKFLHEENSFIEKLARAWDVHPEPPGKGRDRRWTILGTTGQEGDWSAIHDLALIYVMLAHRTDHHLSSEEIEAITDKIGEWVPDASSEEVLQVVKDALKVYAQNPDQQIFDESVAAIKEAVPEHQRPTLLDDLQYVAGSDGQQLRAEQDLIDELARAWDLPSASS